MSEQEFLRNTNLRIVTDVPPNTDGTDKIVYKVTDGKQFFAAKNISPCQYCRLR